MFCEFRLNNWMFCEFRLNNWIFCEFRLNNWMIWIHLPRLSADKLCFMQDSFERNLLPCHTDITCALLCRIVLKRWILCACLWEWHFSWWTSTLVTLIWYVSLIMVIGPSGVQFGLQLYEWLTKSDDREAGVWYVNYEYDYRQNWTTRSPVTNNQNYDKIWERN